MRKRNTKHSLFFANKNLSSNKISGIISTGEGSGCCVTNLNSQENEKQTRTRDFHLTRISSVALKGTKIILTDKND